MPADVQPPKIVETCRVDYQRVLLPVTHGVAQPGGIQVAYVFGKLAPVHEDRSMRTVRRLMQHHHQPRSLHDLRQASKIQERYADRQAPSQWTVFPEILDA